MQETWVLVQSLGPEDPLEEGTATNSRDWWVIIHAVAKESDTGEHMCMHTHPPPHRLTPGGACAKNLPANAGDTRDEGLISGSGKSPGGGHSNPLQLPGKSHGQRNLVGCSPWGHKESDMTERLHFISYTYI